MKSIMAFVRNRRNKDQRNSYKYTVTVSIHKVLVFSGDVVTCDKAVANTM